jgi:hypothetical protein
LLGYVTVPRRGGDLLFFPPRNYSRWRLDLVSPNPPAPHKLKISFASGPIIADKLQAPDQAEPEFVWTPGNPPIAIFNNPAKPGWTGRLEYRIVVW